MEIKEMLEIAYQQTENQTINYLVELFLHNYKDVKQVQDEVYSFNGVLLAIEAWGENEYFVDQVFELYDNVYEEWNYYTAKELSVSRFMEALVNDLTIDLNPLVLKYAIKDYTYEETKDYIILQYDDYYFKIDKLADDTISVNRPTKVKLVEKTITVKEWEWIR